METSFKVKQSDIRAYAFNCFTVLKRAKKGKLSLSTLDLMEILY